jgi:formylglycine-generating enzyme required for sulfatase activity
VQPRHALCAVAISFAAVSGCLLSLPFDDLTRDEPLAPDAAEVAVETSLPDVVDEPLITPADVADAAETNACANKTLDGDESDTDCGGSCPRCSSGRKCRDDGDCLSGNCDSTTKRCALCPASMLRVPVGTQAYCIDPTEVTIAQYDAFVAKVTPKSVVFPAQCKWKNAETSFAPAPKPGGSMNTPVRNVDWCDAWAYCDYHEKRLCGAITSSTSSKPPAPFAQFDDPNVDQWRHACSYSASPAWPYGASADPSKCQTSDRVPDGGVSSVVPVRSLTSCIGAPAELNALYDMSGNVAEWEDSCTGSSGTTDVCRVRGGSFRDRANNSSCGATATRNRGDRSDWVGFRCCKW